MPESRHPGTLTPACHGRQMPSQWESCHWGPPIPCSRCVLPAPRLSCWNISTQKAKTTPRFRTHYGRWVKFSEDLSTEALLLQVRRSPLLVCSIFLIAVRHTTEQLADKLAPRLFDEAKSLLSSALLIVPQPMEFYQAAIILGLWSTTIGQVPLSIDNWMLTGYALQQALASPFFIEAFRCGPSVPVTKAHRDAWCLWNHLAMAHLQYVIQCPDTIPTKVLTILQSLCWYAQAGHAEPVTDRSLPSIRRRR